VDTSERRTDFARNRRQILAAARELLAESPGATMAQVAQSAGVGRSTLYRHFADREELQVALGEPDGEDPGAPGAALEPAAQDLLEPGQLGRASPLAVEATHIFDAVPPYLLAEQLVAEAQRLAGVPLALYALDIDGSHLLRLAGSTEYPERLEAPLAVGPEIGADGIARLRAELRERLPATTAVPLWLRGRGVGVILGLGLPPGALADFASSAAAALTLADVYTDTLERARRRRHPAAAAEIQQNLLPPRIMRISGGEVAGNVLPSYEVAGDWFDVAENAEGTWIALAEAPGSGTHSAAVGAVGLGALRAARRSDCSPAEALLAIHDTLRELPGAKSYVRAAIVHWHPTSRRLGAVACGHAPLLVIRGSGLIEHVVGEGETPLGGRSRPKPVEALTELGPADRVLLVSDGVIDRPLDGGGKLGLEGVADAARRPDTEGAAATVRSVHDAVLSATEADLDDDAAAICLAVH
jgi:serine phosphatase RsbU (regulator of sigma subunit)